MESKANRIYLQVGHETDIGGGKENQDTFLVWRDINLGVLVACVFDGHGREVGKTAALAARESVLNFCQEGVRLLLSDPSSWLIQAHERAHFFIKDSFKRALESQGFEVLEAPEGYLLKRKPSSPTWSCVHGGSSCSIVVVVGGDIYIGNVGDSSATLSSGKSVLHKAQLRHLVDSALISGSSLLHCGGSGSVDSSSDGATATSNTLVITAEHSPESTYEFRRLREFRPRENDPLQPSLLVVYDTPSSHEKTKCNPVFEVNADGEATVTNKGRYYKNVRKEWASLVSTPPSAKFQDALAFTRSLGDLHLHSYGVTHLPEIQHISISTLFESVLCSDLSSMSMAQSSSTDAEADDPLAMPAAAGAEAVDESIVCVVLASDGVWDNWTYEEVTQFVLDKSCVDEVCKHSGGAQMVAQSFMQRNAIYAHRNFGSQADNATGIVIYISSSPILAQEPLVLLNPLNRYDGVQLVLCHTLGRQMRYLKQHHTCQRRSGVAINY